MTIAKGARIGHVHLKAAGLGRVVAGCEKVYKQPISPQTPEY